MSILHRLALLANQTSGLIRAWFPTSTEFSRAKCANSSLNKPRKVKLDSDEKKNFQEKLLRKAEIISDSAEKIRGE